MLPYGHQSISQDDIDDVCTALRGDFLTQGPTLETFEKEFALRVGARHAVALCNATAALHVAMSISGVGPGMRVITTPITFVASANAAAFVGATPDFADVDPVSHNLSPASLLRDWKADTKAVVAVDYAGQACDMPEIARIARARNAMVIEDACHATGGRFHVPGSGKPLHSIGGHPWADITIFSFHPVKTMTTGEGGMLVTDRDDLADHARRLRSHGICRSPAGFVLPDSDPILGEKGPWFHEMQELGWNYRLTDLQAALGRSQLRRLDSFIERRRQIVASYNEGLSGLEWLSRPGLRTPEDKTSTSWHLYAVEIDFEALGCSRTSAMARLREGGVGTQVHYIPVHLQPWYRNTFGYGPGKCPTAEHYYARTLSLPLFPDMTEKDIALVISKVRDLKP